MELLLLRHSTTQGNLEKRYVGSQDHPLVEAGIALAQSKAGDMPSIQKLWISPMIRCRQTAEILFPGMDLHPSEGIKECDFGEFEGKTWADLKDNPMYRAWIDGDATVRFPGGEVLGEHIARCRKAVFDIVAQAESEGLDKIGILAHGGTLMSVMSGYTVPPKDYYDWLPANCGGFLVSVEKSEETMAFHLLKSL